MLHGVPSDSEGVGRDDGGLPQLSSVWESSRSRRPPGVSMEAL